MLAHTIIYILLLFNRYFRILPDMFFAFLLTFKVQNINSTREQSVQLILFCKLLSQQATNYERI